MLREKLPESARKYFLSDSKSNCSKAELRSDSIIDDKPTQQLLLFNDDIPDPTLLISYQQEQDSVFGLIVPE